MKPDLITVWPKNNDYPLWRKQLELSRDHFDKVIIAFMETNQGHDYRDFVKEQLTPLDVIFEEQHKLSPGEDWRDACVHDALAHSKSEWVFFTEQDFFFEESFWQTMTRFLKDKIEVFGFYDAVRLHPCCLFIKRSLLDKTSKDFGIKSGVYDHFGRIQKDLEAMNVPIGCINSGCYHMNGLSSNWTLAANGDTPNYKLEEFRRYIFLCFQCRAVLDAEWIRIAKPYYSPTLPDPSPSKPFSGTKSP